MANTTWIKFLFGFGILVVIIGVYSILQKNYFDGILGLIVGAFLIFINKKVVKGK